MNEKEIVRSYQTAKTPSKQITVLAELNATTTQEIKVILAKNGLIEYTEKPPRKRDFLGLSDLTIEVYALYKQGYSAKQIGERLHMTTNNLWYHIRRAKQFAGEPPQRKTKNHPRYNEMFSLLQQGAPVKTIADKMGLPYRIVYYWTNKMKSSLDHGNGTREQLEKTSK